MNNDSTTRRVTANLPERLLSEACHLSGMGITDTLIEGLELLKRRGAARKAAKLKGKLKLDIDLDSSRERSGH